MKKTNRLIIFALSLAVVISAIVGINVSAAEETENEPSGALEIKSINLVYNDKVELLVAVDVSNQHRDEIEVTYTFDGATYTAELHPTEVLKDSKGDTFPVFTTIGIAPKDIGKDMTFEAHVKDSGATGAAYSASILDYLYARLYKQNFINAESSTDVAKKNLYQNTINYASSALEVLVNNKEGKTEPLYTTYTFAWGADQYSKIASDKFFGAVLEGTVITPTYAGIVELAGWNVYDENGELSRTLGPNDTVAITAPTKIEAVQLGGEDPRPMDYQNGILWNDYVESHFADGVLVTDSYKQNNSALSMGLAVDPKDAANKVLQVRNVANGTEAYTEVQISNDLPIGNCYTFGARMYIAGNTAGYNFAKLRFVTGVDGDEALSLYLLTATDSNGKNEGFAVSVTGANAGLAAGTQIFDPNNFRVAKTNWFDLRVELYYAGNSGINKYDEAAVAEARNNTYLKVYVNNTLVYSANTYWTVAADIEYADIRHLVSGAISNVQYDNIYFTRTDKAYTAD